MSDITSATQKQPSSVILDDKPFYTIMQATKFERANAKSPMPTATPAAPAIRESVLSLTALPLSEPFRPFCASFRALRALYSPTQVGSGDLPGLTAIVGAVADEAPIPRFATCPSLYSIRLHMTLSLFSALSNASELFECSGLKQLIISKNFCGDNVLGSAVLAIVM